MTHLVPLNIVIYSLYTGCPGQKFAHVVFYVFSKYHISKNKGHAIAMKWQGRCIMDQSVDLAVHKQRMEYGTPHLRSLHVR